MKRRNFIQAACVACSAAAIGIELLSLESCSTSSQITRATAENGYVKVALSSLSPEKNVMLIRVSSLDNDLALVKKDEKYLAFYMQCTHRDEPLNAGAKGFYCSAHGSKFSLEGKVEQGPAINALKSFPVSVVNGEALIKIS